MLRAQLWESWEILGNSTQAVLLQENVSSEETKCSTTLYHAKSMAGNKWEELPYSREQRGDPNTCISMKDLTCLSHPLPQWTPLIWVTSCEVSFSTHLINSAVPSVGTPKGQGQEGMSVPSGSTSAKLYMTREQQSNKARSFYINCWSTILPKNSQCLRSEL